MGLSPYEMRELFDQTVVVRQPRFGIVSGYHELPYVCLGKSVESGHSTTQVIGRVQVSPRFQARTVARPSMCIDWIDSND